MEERATATGATVTFTPVHQNRFLFVQRHTDDTILPAYWCFPGGKVEIGETLTDTIVRECFEEIGLKPSGSAFFVDSYLLGKRFGMHFAVQLDSDQIQLGDDLQDFAWVTSESDLSRFHPRIPGINNHLHYTLTHLQRFSRQPELAWTPLEQYDLVEHRFRNH